ncbi:MAG: hypothetical protein IJY46_08990 [Lentisphaeria bacterium]|nr:hypothetical protein [Lentisphaeria bacterium]
MKKVGFLLAVSAAVVLCAQETYIPVEDMMPGNWFVKSVQKTRKDREQYYRSKLDKLKNGAGRAQFAEAFHLMLENNGLPSYRVEDEAIERALKWKKGDFTFHNNFFYTRTGCTSWIITPEVSATGACMVQKNRDYKGQNLLSARLFRAFPGKYKVITVNDLWSSGAGAVMNERGLMIVQNDGNSAVGSAYYNRSTHIGSIFTLRYVAEHCANLDEAAAMMKKLHRMGLVRSLSLYLMADLDRGMIFEATPRYFACGEVNFSFEVRANNYLLPGMRNVIKQKRDAFLNGANRRYAASEFLRNVIAEKGKVAPFDLMRLARFREPEIEKQFKFRSVCVDASLSSIMFVPDRQFPDYLSVTFVALGPQRHTVFLPIPMGLTAVPESLANGDWGKRALDLKKKLPLDHNFIPEFEKVETRFIDEYFVVREQARKLLVNGKRKEAAALLDNVFRRQYKEAQEFLSTISNKAKVIEEKK